MSRLVALLRELPRTSRGLTAAAVAVVVTVPALRAILAVLTGAIVTAIPAAVETGFSSAPGRSLVVRLALFAVAYLLHQLAMGLQAPIAATLGRRLDARLRSRVLQAVAESPGVAHLEEPRLLDLVDQGRRVGPGNQTPGAAADGLVWIAGRYAVVVAGVVMLATFRWWLPVVAVPAMWWGGTRLRKHINVTVGVMVGETRGLRRSRYLADLALAPGSAKELRLFGLGGWLRERYTSSWHASMEPVWRARARSERTLVFPAVVQAVTTALVFGVITAAAIDGDISPGRLATLFGAAQMLWGLAAMSNADVNLAWGLHAVPAVAELEDAIGELRDGMAGELPADGMPRTSVTFDGVSFTYPGAVSPTIDGLDLELRAGESLAIVGSNGVGKTTLVKLLARFYDPSAGRMLVDGTELRDIDPAAWQCRIAAIFQDFTRYELTARENVGLGAPALLDDLDALRDVARRAGALELIEGLPLGWDTVLSRRVEGGVDLSGGEWQRVALARALLAVAGGAGLLVLDEPTANLDARAEAELYDSFLSLTRGVTSIVISHRFSTVRRADRIVVLRDGRVVESGTHDELLAFDGRYARMFRLQAARFEHSEVPSA